jgi:hypothetical protein
MRFRQTVTRWRHRREADGAACLRRIARERTRRPERPLSERSDSKTPGADFSARAQLITMTIRVPHTGPVGRTRATNISVGDHSVVMPAALMRGNSVAISACGRRRAPCLLLRREDVLPREPSPKPPNEPQLARGTPVATNTAISCSCWGVAPLTPTAPRTSLPLRMGAPPASATI